MKKLIPFLLITVFALLITACNTSSVSTDTLPPSQSPTSGPAQQSEITLNHSALSISVGNIEKLIPTLSPAQDNRFLYTSSDPSVAYVDQNGNISAVKEGAAEITVKHSSGTTAACTVTVTQRDDKMDTLITKYGSEIFWNNYYDTGIRVNGNDEIVFSPEFWEINSDQNAPGKNVYQIYIRFTHLSSESLSEEFTYSSLFFELTKEDTDCFNLVLKGHDFDSGFCPIAGESYKIEYKIVHKYRKVVMYYGVYDEVEAPEDLKTSSNYYPSPMPGFMPKDIGQQYISYKATEGGSISGGSLQANPIGENGFEVTAVPRPGYNFVMWNDGVKTPTRSDKTEKFETEYIAYFVKAADENMPIANMYIFTDTGEMITSKEYVNAQLLIVGAKDKKFDISASLQIKGRGNSSWNGGAPSTSYDSKNSYRIKLEEKEQLLGIGESKNRDWILNSNKFDLSGLRNYLVWDFADRMGTFPYVPECQWVQLYVNSEYRGMYMLTERIEVANDRVEVDDTIDSTDKGYLIEIDFRGTDEGQPFFYVTGYGASSNDNPREFVIKSECTQKDVQFIKEYIQSCHDAFVSGDRDAIDELVDIPSLIDMYIIEELTKDVDVGAASFFMQKSPGGKIIFTAPWDFDFGFGTYGKAVNYEEMVSIGREGCTWFSALLEQKWFRDEVLARMADLDDDFKATLAEVRSKGEQLESSADMNAEFWDMYGNRFHGYVSSQVSSNLNSYDEHIDFLIKWSENRWAYMIDFISSYTSYEDYKNQKE